MVRGVVPLTTKRVGHICCIVFWGLKVFVCTLDFCFVYVILSLSNPSMGESNRKEVFMPERHFYLELDCLFAFYIKNRALLILNQ